MELRGQIILLPHPFRDISNYLLQYKMEKYYTFLSRNKNGQSNTLLETHFKEANRKTKNALGG